MNSIIRFFQDNKHAWWMWPFVWTMICTVVMVVCVYTFATLAFMEATPFIIGSLILLGLAILASIIGLCFALMEWFM